MINQKRVVLIVIISICTIMFGNVYANTTDMIKDDSPGIIMKLCANNPLGKDFNSESVSGAEIFSKCKEEHDGYSWGSRIYVLIFAPSWNTNPHKLDIIGNTVDNPITATSKEGHMSLEGEGCNGFIETGFDHGVFFGSIKLSGFRHDITGDGIPDLFGGNRCEKELSILDDGSGRVESKQDGAATITWEYSKNKHISKTLKYSWREATLDFDRKTYSLTDEVKVMLNDLDNLRFPFDDDKVYEIRAYSDTDTMGITLDALWKWDYKGIPQRTGTYPVKFILSDKGESRDNYRLRVTPGDTIYVEYYDYTLPKPHTINDRKKIIATATVEDQIFDKKESLEAKTEITGIDGNPLHHCIHGERAIIKTNISNLDKVPISATIITTIKNSDGIIQDISLTNVMIAPSDSTSVKSEWEMKDDGEHTFEIFVWDSLSSARPLTDTIVTVI